MGDTYTDDNANVFICVHIRIYHDWTNKMYINVKNEQFCTKILSDLYYNLCFEKMYPCFGDLFFYQIENHPDR